MIGRRLGPLLAALCLSTGAPAGDAAVVAGAPFFAQPVPHAGGRDFRLADAAGRERTLTDFRGKVVLLFFGFTSCPDVCPTELSRLAQTTRALGDSADRVQVLFVTLDPERDSAEVIDRYVRAFSPEFIGLRGSPAETAEVARSFRVFFRRIDGDGPGRYTIEHSAYIHAVDPGGNLRLRIAPSLPPEQIAADVRRLLAGE